MTHARLHYRSIISIESAARVAAAAVLCAAFAAGAAELAATVTADGKPLGDAVVIATPVTPPAGGYPRPAAALHATINQVNKQFVPLVKAVRVGTTISFPNNDDVKHHVYSFSPPKRFELPLYAGKTSVPVLFDKAGPVVLGCNIHDWMVAYVYVSESPYFATSDAQGRARLTGLPAGSYRVRVWHPFAAGPEADTARAVEVSAAEPANAKWELKLRPDYRVPRAVPGAAGRGGRY